VAEADSTVETWRDVPGYEGRYQVSDLGRVRSLWHVGQAREEPVILRFRPRVALFREGRREEAQVHRLVLLAFRGPCPEGMHGLHGDDLRARIIAQQATEGNRLPRR